MLITHSNSAKDVEGELGGSVAGNRSAGGVSWVYPDPKERGLGRALHPKPPFYHGSLVSNTRSRRDPNYGIKNAQEEVWRVDEVAAEDLNVDLLLGVEDVLRPYETIVGIYCDVSSPKTRADLSREITPEDIELGKQRWTDLVKHLAELDCNGSEGMYISSYVLMQATRLIEY